MKNKIWEIILMLIPSIIGLFIGILFSFQKVTIEETQTISGEISEFYKGSYSRRLHKSMYIIIDNEKFLVSSGVRWATDFNDLRNVLSVNNVVEIEIMNKKNSKYVVGIKYNDNVFVTIEQTIEGQQQQYDSISTIAFYISYTWLLMIIVFLLGLTNTFGFSFNTGFINKVYLSRLSIIIDCLICTFIFLCSIYIAIVVNKWLYLLGITILFGFALLFLFFQKKVFFGKGGFQFVLNGKNRHYNWNAIKEIMYFPKKEKLTLIINFKEKSDCNTLSINNYIKKYRKEFNKSVYMIRLNKIQKVEFTQLVKRYIDFI